MKNKEILAEKYYKIVIALIITFSLLVSLLAFPST